MSFLLEYFAQLFLGISILGCYNTAKEFVIPIIKKNVGPVAVKLYLQKKVDFKLAKQFPKKIKRRLRELITDVSIMEESCEKNRLAKKVDDIVFLGNLLAARKNKVPRKPEFLSLLQKRSSSIPRQDADLICEVLKKEYKNPVIILEPGQVSNFSKSLKKILRKKVLILDCNQLGKDIAANYEIGFQTSTNYSEICTLTKKMIKAIAFKKLIFVQNVQYLETRKDLETIFTNIISKQRMPKDQLLGKSINLFNSYFIFHSTKEHHPLINLCEKVKMPKKIIPDSNHLQQLYNNQKFELVNDDVLLKDIAKNLRCLESQIKQFCKIFNQAQKTTLLSKSILFVGPSGTGKTSLSQHIAASLKKTLYKIAIPTLHNANQLKGWPKSYLQAQPGLFYSGLKDSDGTIFLLDELDKLSSSQQNEIYAALLEALDPVQNEQIFENYFGEKINLSSNFFIATANEIDRIPSPLLSRFHIIKFEKYSAEQEWEIFKEIILQEFGVNYEKATEEEKDSIKQIFDAGKNLGDIRKLRNFSMHQF